MTVNILIAGFGGQGVLFAGKLLAYAGMISGMEVSWLPSYGPEMRGGTANCSVVLSDEVVGSPIVNNPDILIAMNLPALDKFEGSVVPGGCVFIDSSLIARAAHREDITCRYVPATRLADERGLPGLANMVMIGACVREKALVGEDKLAQALRKVIPERKASMFDKNTEALRLGMEAEA